MRNDGFITKLTASVCGLEADGGVFVTRFLKHDWQPTAIRASAHRKYRALLKFVIAAIPKKNGEYDLGRLSKYIVSLKEDHPKTDAASVLLEPSIPYDYLIQVMDVVRSVEVRGDTEDEEDYVQLALFTQISVGDAP